MNAPLPHIAKRIADKGEILNPIAPLDQPFPKRMSRFVVRCTAIGSALAITIGGGAAAFEAYGTNANWLWAGPVVGGAFASVCFDWDSSPRWGDPDNYRRAKIWCSLLGLGLPAGIATGLVATGTRIGTPGALAMVGTAAGALTASGVWALYEARGRLRLGQYKRPQQSIGR